MKRVQHVLLLVVLFSISTAFGQDMKKTVQYFIKKCASCHTIGNPDSDLDGPDLTDALEYSDEELNDSFDSMEEEISEKISAELRASLIAFFRMENPADYLEKIVKENENSFGEGLDPGNVSIGKSLYDGSTPFKNGAVSCMSCHDRFGSDGLGGSLGPSLVGLYGKMGKTRLYNGIRSSKYKVMKNIYNDHKVTDQEAVHLTTYFESVSAKSSSTGVPGFISYAIIITVAFFGFIAFMYKSRLLDEK